MACYFEEHNCEPLKEGERPDGLLHLARLLLDSGVAFETEFDSYFSDSQAPPPASKQELQNLKTIVYNTEFKVQRCPICLMAFKDEDVLKGLPCHHFFHPSCIIPWLNKTNSCPLCRHELKTDDERYEGFKAYKAREEQRKFELDSLHDSMYG